MLKIAGNVRYQRFLVKPSGRVGVMKVHKNEGMTKAVPR